MISKIIITLCVITVVTAIPPQGAWGGWGAGLGIGPNFLPLWTAPAPWYPQWTPCTAVGSSCVDCSTKLVCTKIGGLRRACSDPSLPYCNLGACSATPSDECAAQPEPVNAA